MDPFQKIGFGSTDPRLGKKIKIGKYTLRYMPMYSDDIWIELPDGEGGQFDLKNFEKAIDKFYKDNF